jgi:hypothetical protein
VKSDGRAAWLIVGICGAEPWITIRVGSNGVDGVRSKRQRAGIAENRPGSVLGGLRLKWEDGCTGRMIPPVSLANWNDLAKSLTLTRNP